MEHGTFGQTVKSKEEMIMAIQVHFIDPNADDDKARMVTELLVLLALKKMTA